MNTLEAPPETAGMPTQSSPRVLIVDDEVALQALASAIVKKLEYESAVASTGEEAVEMFRKAHSEGAGFSVVVMDLALPGGISGLEATLAIKQIDPGAKVIVSSGYLEQNARNAALQHGFAGILPKPYTADRLATELRWIVKQGEHGV